jgi:hypothetical protein
MDNKNKELTKETEAKHLAQMNDLVKHWEQKCGQMQGEKEKELNKHISELKESVESIAEE